MTDTTTVASTPAPALDLPIQKTQRGGGGQKWALIAVPVVLVLVLMAAAAIAVPQMLRGSGAAGVPPLPSATSAAAGASATPQGAGQGQGEAAAVVGSVGFRDSAAVLDEVIFSARKLPPPGTGKQYQGWLLGAGGERRLSAGVLKMGEDGSAQLNFIDREGTNLLTKFDAFEITLEPSPDSNSDSSGDVVFSGALPPQAMVHVGHLLIASEDTPDKISSCAGLLGATTLLNDLALDMAGGQRDGDLARVKRAAEGMVNVIEGQQGEHFGDVDHDGFPNAPGDGFGILLNGTHGYVQDVIHHAELSTKMVDATAGIRDHGGHVIVSAKNASDFAAQARDVALRIAAATSVDAIQSDVKLAQTLAGQVMNGKDINGDEKIDHIPGEAAAKEAYQHAQYMADIPIFAGDTPPVFSSGSAGSSDHPTQHAESTPAP